MEGILRRSGGGWKRLEGGFEIRDLGFGRALGGDVGYAFEEDVDGDEVAVFLADEVAGVDVVHADARGGVFEDEVVVEGGDGTPALGGEFGDEFGLCGVCAFDVGLDGPDDAVAAGIF